MPLVLTPPSIDREPLSIDLSGIVPHTVRELDRAAIARLPIRADGRTARIAAMHSATWAMPPSARSSRATIVSTT
jgi:hypothetical protein